MYTAAVCDRPHTITVPLLLYQIIVMRNEIQMFMKCQQYQKISTNHKFRHFQTIISNSYYLRFLLTYFEDNFLCYKIWMQGILKQFEADLTLAISALQYCKINYDSINIWISWWGRHWAKASIAYIYIIKQLNNCHSKIGSHLVFFKTWLSCCPLDFDFIC